QQAFTHMEAGEPRHIVLHRQADSWTLHYDGQSYDFGWHTTNQHDGTTAVTTQIDGQSMQATTVLDGGTIHVFAEGAVHALGTHDPAAYGETGADSLLGGLTAPMPGKIITVA